MNLIKFDYFIFGNVHATTASSTSEFFFFPNISIPPFTEKQKIGVWSFQLDLLID